MSFLMHTDNFPSIQYINTKFETFPNLCMTTYMLTKKVNIIDKQTEIKTIKIIKSISCPKAISGEHGPTIKKLFMDIDASLKIRIVSNDTLYN